MKPNQLCSLDSSFISGDLFKSIADVYIDEDKRFVTEDELKNFSIIFIKGDWISQFKTKILPKINHPFKLITHNADTAAPLPHIDLLEDKRVIKWFGMNSNIIHDKFQSIPIGIANKKWPHGNTSVLQEIINRKNPKQQLVYCNFNPNTAPVRWSILKELKKISFIDFEVSSLSPKDYWNKLSQYKYVISPPGNSIDCHRIWESIYLGTIPIVLDHMCHDYWKDLPILFLQNYRDISTKHLLEVHSELKNNPIYKSYLPHYQELIHEDR